MVNYLAPESNPGVRFALQHRSSDEGLVIAHVNTGQVASLLHTGCLSLVPGQWLVHHQLVAVQIPGDVAIRARALGWGWRSDAACWCVGRWRNVFLSKNKGLTAICLNASVTRRRTNGVCTDISSWSRRSCDSYHKHHRSTCRSPGDCESSPHNVPVENDKKASGCQTLNVRVLSKVCPACSTNQT